MRCGPWGRQVSRHNTFYVLSGSRTCIRMTRMPPDFPWPRRRTHAVRRRATVHSTPPFDEIAGLRHTSSHTKFQRSLPRFSLPGSSGGTHRGWVAPVSTRFSPTAPAKTLPESAIPACTRCLLLCCCVRKTSARRAVPVSRFCATGISKASSASLCALAGYPSRTQQDLAGESSSRARPHAYGRFP